MNDYKIAREDLCNKLSIRKNILTYVLYEKEIENCYTSFTIPKKNGGERNIDAPVAELKYIQKKLSFYLTDVRNKNIKKDNLIISHGFEKGKNIITNAKSHQKKRFVINLDIENFFPSFNFGRVRGYFIKNKMFKFSKEESTIIAQLSTYQNVLPQGAPTSPIISNLIFNIIDMRIINIAKKYKLNYTRYADDLTFSTNDYSIIDNYSYFMNDISNLLERSGFNLNDKKSRIIFSNSRQEVTGLTVNKKVNVTRKFSEDTRAMLDSLFKRGFYYIDNTDNIVSNIDQLEGRLSFINQIDWYNNKLDKKYKNINIDNKFNKNSFNKRERQMRYFLFYKYFYAPNKLTIVTEGKTDVMHIKAALMHYYKDYPNLITKESNRYKYNVHFFTKTDRIIFFLGLVDGGHTFNNIYNYYKLKKGLSFYDYINNKRLKTLISYGKDALDTNKYDELKKIDKSYKHYIDSVNNVRESREIKENDYLDAGIKLLESMYGIRDLSIQNPIILLIDNENKKNSPLNKFNNLTNIGLGANGNCKKVIQNLYAITYPFIDGKKLVEIEDLYDAKTLSTIIDGKKFSRKKDAGKSNSYGKNIFAKYILKNYESIDFSRFRPILDQINELYNKKSRYF